MNTETTSNEATVTASQIPRLWTGVTEYVEVDGVKFALSTHHDSDMAAPWKDDDGCGIVTDWVSRNKYPGERVLMEDRGSKRYFDFKGTMEKAKRDGWGLSDEERAKLTEKLGRDPTQKEITVAAVESNFEYLRRWCNDDWYYVWLKVMVQTCEGMPEFEGEYDTLGGLSSEDQANTAFYAVDMIEGFLRQIRKARAAKDAHKLKMERIASGVLIKLIEADASEQLCNEFKELYEAAGVRLGN